MLSNHQPDNFNYSDDIGIFSSRAGDMQLKPNSLDCTVRKAGLKIKVQPDDQLFNNSDNQVQNVDIFTYLGSRITPDGDTEIDIYCRIRKTQGAFVQLRHIWRFNTISAKIKLRLFSSLIGTIVSLWDLASVIAFTRQKQLFVNHCCRCYSEYGAHKPYPILNCIEDTNQSNIRLEMKERKWR